MVRKLTNAGVVLSAHGLLVIYPRTLIVEAELPGLLPYFSHSAPLWLRHIHFLKRIFEYRRVKPRYVFVSR
jgi:hypothetical protein